MSLFPAEHETIEGVGRALRSGQTTCVEVLNKCLDRIAEWEGRVKAWVVVDGDRAVERAHSLDREIESGEYRGPLHGVPIGVKDIIDVRGLPTAAGFQPWRGRIAEKDAVLVSDLRHSGAVILGKTATTQFAWIDPPPTCNPWDLNRTPGGSSSGSAVAVALGMCLGALGTQTGGSIIRPAAFCGVAGYKPHGKRWEQLSGGIVPLAPTLDHPGVIARCSTDLSIIVNAIVERHRSVQLRVNEADPDFSPYPPKLIRFRGFFDRRAEPVMLVAFEMALAALADGGAEIIEIDDDAFDFEGIVKKHRLIMAAEAAAEHELRLSQHGEHYAPRIRALVEEGLATPVTSYIRALQDQRERSRSLTLESRQLGQRGGSIVTPAALGPAPDRSTTGDPCMNSPWSYLGWPAASLPIALAPNGLPLAIQLVGFGIFSEMIAGDLLKTAAWCESVIRNASRAGSH